MDKEVREITKLLRDGLTVEERKGGHPKIKGPRGETLYSLPSSPGRGRWKQNLMAELKRRGLLKDG